MDKCERPQSYIGYLDSLKGIGILAITMIHTGAAGLPGLIGLIGIAGERGVQLFFIISAILNFYSSERFFGSPHNVRIGNCLQWYVKKLKRLLPMYYIALLSSMVAGTYSTYWLGNEKSVSLPNVLAHVLLLHGFVPHYTNSMLGVDWYLGVLFIFLLSTPLLYKIVTSLERSVILLLVLYLSIPLINNKLLYLLVPVENDPIIYNAYIMNFGPLSQLMVYLMGIVVFFVVKHIKAVGDKAIRFILSIVLLLFSIAMILGQVTGKNTLFNVSVGDMYGIWFSIIIVSQSIYSNKLVDQAFFRLLGKYSYGMYLFQFVWINSYEKFFSHEGVKKWLIEYLVSLAALLVISISLEKLISRIENILLYTIRKEI